MALISVIIPVYNAQEYLHECIDSVLAQTHTKLQIIIINDGSTDGSEQILEQYAARDPRVEVINIPNSGVSEARNIGLESVKGEWVTFVDADDALPPYALKLMQASAIRSSSQIVAGKFELVKAMPNKMPTHAGRVKLDVLGGETAMVRCLNQTGLDNSVWGKLIAAPLLDFRVRFRQGRFEDLDILYRIYDRARRVCHLQAVTYYYRRNPEGFIFNINAEGRFDSLDVCDRILEYTQLYSTRVKRAARARALAAAYNALGLMIHHNIKDPDMEERCFKSLKLNRAAVCWSRAARRRDRLGAFLAYAPRWVIKTMLLRYHPGLY